MSNQYRVEPSTPVTVGSVREPGSVAGTGAGRSPARAVGPSMAQGCAALLLLAVGTALVLGQAVRCTTHGDPAFSCPEWQVLPATGNHDDTQAQEGEGMATIQVTPQFRIMPIMSGGSGGWSGILSVLPKLCRLLLNHDVTRNHVVVRQSLPCRSMT